MKKIILLLLIFNATFSFSQTSVYHPFPDSNAVWNFKCIQIWCVPIGPGWPGYIEMDYSILINGDSLANGYTYHKLYTPYIDVVMNNNCQNWMVNGHKGAIREDTVLKKVYYVPPGDTAESLLYDFTLQVGDTITGHLAGFLNQGLQSDTVVAIDSVLIGQDYRRRWLINPSYNIFITEGIGSNYGFFEFSPGNIPDFPGYTFSCFKQDGQTLFPSPTSNCELITSLPHIASARNDFHFYPNPSHGSLTMKSPDSGIQEIYLTDLSGRLIKTIHAGGAKEFHLTGLPEGMFILKARFSENHEMRKLIRVEH